MIWSFSPRTSWSDGTIRERLHEVAGHVTVAYRYGFDALHIGDKPGDPSLRLQPTVTMGHLLEVWPDRPFGVLAVLPPRNPMLLAEELRTLRAMSEAPFTLITALGTRDETRAVGVEVGNLLKVYDDHLSTLRAELNDAGTHWYGAANNDAAITRVARTLDGWIGSSRTSDEEALARLHTYRTACEVAGRPVGRRLLRRDLSSGGGSAVHLSVEPEQICARVRDLADGGFDEIVFRPSIDSDSTEVLAALASARDRYEGSGGGQRRSPTGGHDVTRRE